MINESKQKAALQAIHNLIIQSKIMAGGTGSTMLFEFLDHVEYLPGLILESQDQTATFEAYLKQICEDYKLDYIFKFYAECEYQTIDSQKYTIVLNVDQGTYVSQLNAINEYEALFEWMKLTKYDGIPDFNGSKKAILLQKLNDELGIPVPLEGMSEVFCSAFTIDEELYLFTIVKQS